MSSDNISFIMLLITLAALASPIITTVIKNQHEMELKEFEEKHEHSDIRFFRPYKLSAIEKYIDATSAIMSGCRSADKSAYWRASAVLRLYAPKRMWPHIDSVDKDVDDNDAGKMREDLIELCKQLHFAFYG